MSITRLSALLPLLLLTACQGAAQSGSTAQSDRPERWNFNFFTPKALYAVVTFAVVIDAENQASRFVTLNKTPAMDEVTGEWNTHSRVSRGHWNHVKYPPKQMFFCWDSVIDKKVYETRLTFSDEVIEKMYRPSIYKDYQGNTAWYDNIQIGLAPEGKVAIWLRGIGFEPNYRVIPARLNTVSGEDLVICEGVTRFSNGYEYPETTNEFIKGKVYPYGVW
ncbi:DUF2931 family protein [Erwinia rhapontici]|uniref:Lipoprotein n=1 Tax=Erwinia rhapontici TaxID=55212 RepID=A0ABM7N458_ERWRD|nr:DUF2931 family protein [Erwinia rhapontici]TDS96389.1 DUF2931 family protein [Erwinia rhapontici]UDQ79352.1 DUF2931 family protein [Erwinia rhapontici]BCQ36267.1 lipoprotein [Erwinia rhapontici]